MPQKPANKKSPAKKGRYTIGRVMADVRHAIIRKGDRMATSMGTFIDWTGPKGLRAYIKGMDEGARGRDGGPVRRA